jgi:hypothetical protein
MRGGTFVEAGSCGLVLAHFMESRQTNLQDPPVPFGLSKIMSKEGGAVA